MKDRVFPTDKIYSAVLLAIGAMTVIPNANAAYKLGQGTRVQVDVDESINRTDTFDGHDETNKKDSAATQGIRNRSGNAVRLIWYGNPAQKDAVNNGEIHGKIDFTGGTVVDDNNDQAAKWHNENASAFADGQGNGIDAYGWTSRNNTNSVQYRINTISNQGTITGDGILKGGESDKKSYLFSNASGNGISFFSQTEYGSALSFITGSAVSGGSGSRTARVRTARSVPTAARTTDIPETASPTLNDDTNFHGKSIDISLNQLDNNGILRGNIVLKGNTENGNAQDNSVQYFPSVSYGSGNGANLFGYVYTPDTLTYSWKKTNTVKLNTLTNSGVMAGRADINGGGNLHPSVLGWSYTRTWDTGNGISVAANTLKGAKHATLANLGDVTNDGRISGTLTTKSEKNNFVPNDNTNNYLNVIDSSTEALGSGNGINIRAVTESSSESAAAHLGSLTNRGRITGTAALRAAETGVDKIGVIANGVGDGVSVFLKTQIGGNDSVGIGKIDNSGIISGALYTKAGTTLDTNATADAALMHGEEEVKLLVSTKDFGLKSFDVTDQTPETPKNAYKYDYWTGDNRKHVVLNTDATTTVYGSGNGISLFNGKKPSGSPVPSMGNINNRGVISGYSRMIHGYGANGYARADFLGTGTGIAINNEMTGTIDNRGIISGNQSALLALGKIDDSQSVLHPDFKPGYAQDSIHNYGLMAGTMIAGSYDVRSNSDTNQQSYKYFGLEDVSDTDNPLKNYGTLVYLKKGLVKNPAYYANKPQRNADAESIDKVVAAENSEQTVAGQTYQIINAPVTDDKKDSELTTDKNSYENTLLNGVGAAQAALIANQDLTLKNSIVNGFVHALKLNDAMTLTLDNTIINSNGFKVRIQDGKGSYTEINPYAITAAADKNKTLVLKNNATVNGDVTLNGGNNTVTIADNTVHLNGNHFNVGSGENTLILGDKIIRSGEKPITLYQPFEGHFEHLSVNKPAAIHQKETGIGSVADTVIHSTLTYYGNYKMNDGDRLTFSVAGKEENEHGQLHVIGGSADIRKGELFVQAESLAKDAMVKGDKVLNIIKVEDVAVRNVVDNEPNADSSAEDGTTTHPYQVIGNFKSYQDNSELFDFAPDYERNAVHLIVTKAAEEPKKPETPPKPNKPETPPKPNKPEKPQHPNKPEESQQTMVAKNKPQKDEVKKVVPKKDHSENTPTDSTPPLIVRIVQDSGYDDLVDAAKSIDAALQKNVTSDFSRQFWIPATRQEAATAVVESVPLFTGATGNIVSDVVNQDKHTLLHHASGISDIQIGLSGGVITQKGEHGRAGYRNRNHGLQISGNKSLDNHTDIGALFSYNRSRAESRHFAAKHKADINTFDMAAYASYPITDRLTTEFDIGYAHSTVKGKRFVSFTGPDRVAKSDFTLHTAYAGAGIRYRFGDDKRTVEPYLHTDVTVNKRNGYHEQGLGTLNLIVDPYTQTGLSVEAGAQAQYQFNKQFALQGQVGIAYNIADTQAKATAVYEGDATPRKFSVYAADRGRVQATLNLGASYQITPNATVSTYYQTTGRKGATDNHVGVNFRIDF